MKPICTGVDSTVYLAKDEKHIIKKYGYRRKMPIIKKYHYLQKSLSDKGNFIIDSEGEFNSETFNKIEINILGIENSIKEIKTKLFDILEVKNVISRQKYIKGETLSESKKIKINKKDVIGKIVKIIQKQIKVYKYDDLNAMNMMITGIKEGTLQITITDIGADILDLVKRNEKYIDKQSKI